MGKDKILGFGGSVSNNKKGVRPLFGAERTLESVMTPNSQIKTPASLQASHAVPSPCLAKASSQRQTHAPHRTAPHQQTHGPFLPTVEPRHPLSLGILAKPRNAPLPLQLISAPDPPSNNDNNDDNVPPNTSPNHPSIDPSTKTRGTSTGGPHLDN
ncbi:hypothetical protein PCL_06338 [Purpureocillium lilacinum]|uniref:Uncharacterized protein n=1 Tax=Purpureocillium lilacinum TaxID=33203 RepID=A0A2U3EMK6_PURLI|nr:hypothetical protein PCL_06338 [Purpureocillium lilacinum]